MFRFTKKKVLILASTLVAVAGATVALVLLLKPKQNDGIEPRILDKADDYDYILYRNQDSGSAIITGIKYPATELIIPDYIEAGGMKYYVNDVCNIGCSDTISKIHLPKYLIGLNHPYELPDPSVSYRDVFMRLPNLKEFEIDSSNKYFKTRDGVLFKITGDGIFLWKYPGGKPDKTYTIPNDFGKIRVHNDAFSSSVNLENIEVGINYNGTEFISYQSRDGILYEHHHGINQLTGEEVDNSEIVCIPGGKRGSIVIPNSVNLWPYAFGEMPYLTSIKYPENYDGNLGIRESTSFDSLTNITIPLSSNTYKSVDNVIYSKDGKKLYFCPNKIAGKSYSIKEGVELTDSGCFVGCKDLESLTLPSTLKSFSMYADERTNIQNYFVSNNNSNFSSINGFLFEKGTNNLIRIPEGRNDTVVIPEGTTKICDISNCKFRKIEIPNSVTEIGQILRCVNLEEISIPDSVTLYGIYQYSPTNPDQIIYRRYDIFRRCDSLKKIHLGRNIDCLEFGAYSVCTSTSVEITVSSENPYFSIHDGLVLNKEGTELIKCYKPLLTSITIPTSVETVKAEALCNLLCAEELTFSNSVKTWVKLNNYFSFSRINFDGSLSEWESLDLILPPGCTLYYNDGQITG